VIFRLLLAFVVTAAVGLTACEKGEEAEPEQKAPETGAVSEEKTMVEQAAEVLEEGAEKASEMAGAAMEKGAEMAGSAKDQGEEMTTAAKETGAEMAGATVAKAEELIQKAKDYIENNEIDLAGEVMEQLRTLKDSLPEKLQEQIDKLEAMLPSKTDAPVGTEH
jgi:acyl-CoA reductase-like NAD-dependent aldehyde dehydrogenase